MASDLIPAFGSLALLLNPSPLPPPLESDLKHTPPAEEREEDHLFKDWCGVRADLGRCGFGFTVQYIGEVEGNVSGGMKRGAVYAGLLNVALDQDLEKLARWNGGAFHVAMLFPHGHGLSANHTGDLFVLSNLDAPSDPRLFEIWFQQTFAGSAFSIRAGQIAADQEFAFTEQGALFNNSAFGWIPIGGANIPAPIYPQGALGARLAWHPCDCWYLQAGVFDGNPNPIDGHGRQINPNGVNFRLDEGALIISEVGGTWRTAQNDLPGVAKLGGWYHTASFNHERFDHEGLSLADPASSGVPRRLRGNRGMYLAAEQKLWCEPSERQKSMQGLGTFARFGVAPPDQNRLQVYAEGGLTYQGLIPQRDDDKIGVAIAYGSLSYDLRELAEDRNKFNTASSPLPDHEVVIETDYRAFIRTSWSLQTGLQYIIHPGGSAVIPDALVLGLRTQFDF